METLPGQYLIVLKCDRCQQQRNIKRTQQDDWMIVDTLAVDVGVSSFRASK